MAIFGRKESKEEKAKAKTEEYLLARGLKDLDSSYNKQVKSVSDDMETNGILKDMYAVTFSGDVVDRAKLNYMTAQIEQNWILVKQQDEILKELKKLNDK